MENGQTIKNCIRAEFSKENNISRHIFWKFGIQNQQIRYKIRSGMKKENWREKRQQYHLPYALVWYENKYDHFSFHLCQFFLFWGKSSFFMPIFHLNAKFKPGICRIFTCHWTFIIMSVSIATWRDCTVHRIQFLFRNVKIRILCTALHAPSFSAHVYEWNVKLSRLSLQVHLYRLMNCCRLLCKI